MDKDIRFAEKKIDAGWKESIEKEKGTSEKKAASQEIKNEKKPKETSPGFMNLMNSLAFQVLMHLGEIPNPETNQPQKDREAAKATIDLILQLKEKTEGNLSDQEAGFFSAVLPELQMKFVQNS